MRRLGLKRSTLLPLHLQYALRYMSAHDEFCLLLKPKTFSQKLFYKMIYDRRPLLVTFADKLQAREYVRRKIGDDILTELFLTTDRPEEIKFEELPQRFVVKANHGSGYVRIVDQLRDQESDVRQTCQKWLSQKYSDWNWEWFYKPISPRVLVERMLESGGGGAPCDYKFFVFNGKAFMIQVDSDRFSEHRRDLFSRDWKRFRVRYKCPYMKGNIPRPAYLPKMLEIAECLGAEVDFVRVDLYEVGGRIFFGELTNVPTGGWGKFDPREFDAILGSQWQIVGY